LDLFLGDEGSGAYLGKRFICDFIRGDMPKEARQNFQDYCPLNGDQLIDEIYTKPFPNRFLRKIQQRLSLPMLKMATIFTS
jgi:N-acetylglucosamine kinase-like BadF-type ATPase